MQLYQFLISVRASQDGGRTQQLMNEEGEVTSHLQGFLSRSVRLLEAGLKPVFVFDGHAPTLKGGELAKRKAAKAHAEEELKAAEARVEAAEGEEDRAKAIEDANAFSKRTVRLIFCGARAHPIRAGGGALTQADRRCARRASKTKT